MALKYTLPKGYNISNFQKVKTQNNSSVARQGYKYKATLTKKPAEQKQPTQAAVPQAAPEVPEIVSSPFEQQLQQQATDQQNSLQSLMSQLQQSQATLANQASVFQKERQNMLTQYYDSRKLLDQQLMDLSKSQAEMENQMLMAQYDRQHYSDMMDSANITPEAVNSSRTKARSLSLLRSFYRPSSITRG